MYCCYIKHKRKRYRRNAICPDKIDILVKDISTEGPALDLHKKMKYNILTKVFGTIVTVSGLNFVILTSVK